MKYKRLKKLTPREIHRTLDLIRLGPLGIDPLADLRLCRAGLAEPYIRIKDQDDPMPAMFQLAKDARERRQSNLSLGGRFLVTATPVSEARLLNSRGSIRKHWWGHAGLTFSEYMT